jgi:K+-sensing histidine kinase KdpD
LKNYKQKQRWQLVLFISAVLVGIASLTYTNQLVQKMSMQEQIKAKMLANAWTQIVNSTDNTNLDFYAGIIEDNHTIPVIVTDSALKIVLTRNLDADRLNNLRYINRKLRKMKEHADPIIIPLSPTEKQYLYYSKSILLIQLQYYPYIQLAIVLLFIVVAYFAFNTSRKFEQNQVWIGLSKETAHQLGTPISSLMAWLEMMKIRNGDKEMLIELEKDITRLEKITERFSKIGSQPVLVQENVITVIETAVNYIKTRSSDKIKFTLALPVQEILVPMNSSLFEWVIENLCKNAIDALQGQGEIKISVLELFTNVQIDVSDTGKGIPKSMFTTVFKPGFTTKKKGWGLGLSLVKRIVEEYHDGKVYVHQSELNKGTIFRIILKKQ